MKDLRKDLEKILLELLCKWDKGGLAEEEAEDKILSLFKQQMKEEIKKVKHQFSKNVTAHKKRNIDKGLCWDCNEPKINGWYCAKHLELHRAKSRESYYKRKEILNNIESL